MDGSGIPSLDLAVDPAHLNEGLLQILHEIRPGWERGSIKFKAIEHGMVNNHVICYITDSIDDSAIVLRVYGKGGNTLFGDLFDRQREEQSVKLTGGLGLGPKCCCTFNNGYGTQFMPGDTYGWDPDSLGVFRDIEMGRKVAKYLARFHCKDTLEKSRAYTDKKGVHLIGQSRKQLERTWMDKIKNQELTDYFYEVWPSSKEELLKELEFWQKEEEEMDIEERFIHGDPNHTNMIFDKESGALVLVDYEVTGLGNPVQDLAWYLNITSIGIFREDVETLLFSREYEETFVRTYLEERRRLDREAPPTGAEVQRLYAMVQKYFLIYSLGFAMWIPEFSNSTDKMTLGVLKVYLSSWRGRVQHYFKNKDRVFSLATTKV